MKGERVIHSIAQGLSYVLYPLFVPTYGMVLFCFAFSRQTVALPWAWSLIAISGTFLLTCVLPLTAILLLMKSGQVSSLQIENASERTMPYVYASVGFACWAYLLIRILHAPLSLNMIAVGATVAIIIVALINRRWKISAHLTGFGGLVGGVMSYYISVGVVPSWGAMSAWLGGTLILMYARLYLHAHTPAQVAAGWLLGLSCTALPYSIIAYVWS